ncbi:SubName: Full=Uncharacterized protein {ECO:0000313/EMBL:CCA71607.1} [Serendipita indica DSM 11827]|nr:SubName: Full=Uncharacterized protein {ECO:0000313/EMBL:CCA71607.1} [Serendipita indica DSM 11827]
MSTAPQTPKKSRIRKKTPIRRLGTPFKGSHLPRGSPARSTVSTLKGDDESEWTGYKYEAGETSIHEHDDDQTLRASDSEMEEKPIALFGRGPRVLFRSTEPSPDPRGRKRSNSIVRRAEKRSRRKSRSTTRTSVVFDLATLDRNTTTPINRVRRVKRWMRENSARSINRSNRIHMDEDTEQLINKNFARGYQSKSDEREYEETPTRHPPFTPLLLSAVCRYWRSIVTNQPLLWLYVAIPQTEKISRRQRERILYYSARLASHLPIAYTYERTRSRAQQYGLVAVLREAFAAYQTFEIRKGKHLDSRILSLFLEKLSPQAETLRLLSQAHTRMIDRDCWNLSGTAVCNVSRLSCLGLSVRIQRTPRQGLETFGKLRSLAIRDTVCLSADLQECLENLGSVEHLELDGTTFRSNHAPKRVTIPSLTFLSCNLVQFYDLHFLGSAPKIQTLELRLLEAHYKSHWERFSHLAIGQVAIRDLRISSSKDLDYSPKGEQMYLDVIQHFRNIQSLELSGTFAILSLQALPNPHIPLAELQRVSIRESKIQGDDIDAFLSRFRSRHNRLLDIICRGCRNVDNTGGACASFSVSQ